MFKRRYRQPSLGLQQHRRFSPAMLLGLSVPLVLTLIAAGVFVLPHLGTHAAALNMDCTLIVPPNPLSAQGLATPYQLLATNPANGPCNEANANQAAFVQGAIINPITGQISIYNPLVVDQGTQPAVAPTPPQLPPGAVVGLWFGSNGNTLTLQDNNGSLAQGHCVNGLPGSIFGQFSYCNAPAFFFSANLAIRTGRLKVPPLGTAKDGMPCPSTRDFSLVDQDQSDNVTTTYLVTANGTTAQATAANKAALQNAQTQTNGSDERLLAVAVDGALGCTAFMAPNLADNGNMVPALPLNELQAAAFQAPPVALVPLGDPMTLVNGQPSLTKTNLYRAGVDQPPAQNGVNTPMAQNNNVQNNFRFGNTDPNTTTYCRNLLNIAPARLMKDQQFTQGRPSPAADVANSLFTFLAQRFNATFGPNNLNCTGLLNVPNPVTVTTDGNGVATAATITMPAGQAGTGTTMTPTPTVGTCPTAPPIPLMGEGRRHGPGMPATPIPTMGTCTPTTSPSTMGTDPTVTPTPTTGTGTTTTPTPMGGTGQQQQQ